MKFFYINKYLIARFRFQYCNNKFPELFNSYFEYNSGYHNYNTCSTQYFHIPQIKANPAKLGIKYRGAIKLIAILNRDINPDTSESIFVKFLKQIVDVLL